MSALRIDPLPTDAGGVSYEIFDTDRGQPLAGRFLTLEGAARLVAAENLRPRLPFPSADEYLAALKSEVAQVLAAHRGVEAQR
jgi:hypothetical protein